MNNKNKTNVVAELNEIGATTLKTEDTKGGETMTTTAKKTVVPVEEMVEFREENRKVFRMSDGSKRMEVYAHPVHVFNKAEQRFEDIDGELVEDDDGRHLRNRRNRFVARFNKADDSDEIFHIEKDRCRVRFSQVHSDSPERTCGRRDESRKNGWTIEGADGRSSLVYTVCGDGVKEDILVHAPSEDYRYPFVLECENVVPEWLADERRVVFRDPDTKTVIFQTPPPFMTDASGVCSEQVWYEWAEQADGKILFTVAADADWMNDRDRAFPVTIDPQVVVNSNASLVSYSFSSDSNSVTASTIRHVVGTTASGTVNRTYLTFTNPTFPKHVRIKKAELKVVQELGLYSSETLPLIGLYEVPCTVALPMANPGFQGDPIDYEPLKTGTTTDSEEVAYTFDVTHFIEKLISGDASAPSLVLKMIDETVKKDDCIQVFSAEYTPHPMCLTIDYEENYDVNTSYETHRHDAGWLGQGFVDLRNGNLMFDVTDMAWGGNRMPVTIKHLYNSGLSDTQYTYNAGKDLLIGDFSAMNVGNGWRLNLMQSIRLNRFIHDGQTCLGYIYADENGKQTYFLCDDGTGMYHAVDASGLVFDANTYTIDMGDETYRFDETSGLLTQITDQHDNSMTITYTNGQIATVTDGAGRVFAFAYNDSHFLTSITAPDGQTKVEYTYSGNSLTGMVFPGNRCATLNTYDNRITSILLYENESCTDRLTYGYETDTERVRSVGGLGSIVQYAYSVAARSTTVTVTIPQDEDETQDTVITTVYTFDEDGNVASRYAYTNDSGKVGVEGETGSGIHPYADDGGMTTMGSGANLLRGHTFQTLSWTTVNAEDGFTIECDSNGSCSKFYYDQLHMVSESTAFAGKGVGQNIVLPAGDYTFSAYVKVESALEGSDAVLNPGAYLRVTVPGSSTLSETERLTAVEDEHIRLIAPFTLTSEQEVWVYLLMDGAGEVRIDGAQLENNPFASDYNLLENGNFFCGTTGWTFSESGVDVSTDECFNMAKSLKMTGSPTTACQAVQKVAIDPTRSTKETFTLSGWAKGCGLVRRDRENGEEPVFRLRAYIRYTDTEYGEDSYEDFTADFAPCTQDWQFASVQIEKSKYRAVREFGVYCEYCHNVGTAYFDDIRLVRNSVQTDLSPSDFVYESDYEEDGSDTDTPRVYTAEDDAPTFEEVQDAFGNALTETTFTDGEFGTLYRSFGYNDSGNDLVRETDTRGNHTAYTVDAVHSRNDSVTDRCGNITAYTYDAVGRTTGVTSQDNGGNTLATVTYAYDASDNMTDIVRGDGLNYVLSYNGYHRLTSIGIDGKTEPLVQYTYKNGTGRLKQVTYANGDTMKASYNSFGQMIAETWYDVSNTLTAHYQYVYDGSGNLVRSIDRIALKEYTYSYEDGKLMRAATYDISVSSDGFVTSRTLVSTIHYRYDADGNLTKKHMRFSSGGKRTVYYEQNANDQTVVKFDANGKTVTCHSKTDHFGRKEFDELQHASGFLYRKFRYHDGAFTAEHQTGEALKSTSTTQLVREIEFSDGRTISYEYDAEERITKVTDSVDGITEYTYDALGQLLTETVKADETAAPTAVNTMTYDRYGNITSKNGVTYTYGNAVWKDLLTAVGEKTISYDAQGNPMTYFGKSLTWEKGRQLKSFGSTTYTYNANGIRVGKVCRSSLVYTYEVEGSKILSQTLRFGTATQTIVPLYDNEDAVCGIVYNGETYYFRKNLQGDIIAITDENGTEVGRYTYDAWGVCTEIAPNEDSVVYDNPFRYRGYYYDVDTELYYVSSRYYDPEIGRFLNSDDAQFSIINELVLSHNLFSYCYNSPIVNSDTTGYIAHNVVGAVVGVFMSLGTYFLGILMGFDTFSWWSLLWAVVGGAASGAFGASVYKRAIQVIFNIIDSVAVNVISCLKKAKVTLEQVVQEVFIGAVVGLISGLVGGSGNGKLFKKASNQYVKKWLSRNKNLIIKGTKYYIKSFAKLLKQKVVKPVFKAFMAGMITNTVLRKKFERLLA